MKLWNVQTGRRQKLLNEHESSVSSMLITSQNENQLVCGLLNGYVAVYNLISGEMEHAFEAHMADKSVLCLCESLDGKLITGSKDCTIKLWNLNHEQSDLHKMQQSIKTLIGHSDWVRSMCVCSFNRWLVSASGDSSIRVWDLELGKYLKTLAGHSRSVNKVIMYKDDLLLSGSDDLTIKLWNLCNAECLKTFIGHSGPIFSLLINSNEDELFSGSADRTIRVWNLKNDGYNECLQTLNGHSNSVESLVKSNNYLISCSDDQTIKFWH
jgi:WD40 repeat protein